jgi:hypothetical protein
MKTSEIRILSRLRHPHLATMRRRAATQAMLALSMALASCGGGSAGAGGSVSPIAAAPVDTPTPAPSATSTAAATPVASPSPEPTTVASGSLPVETDFPSIPSNFDIATELAPADGTGAIPGSAAPDDSGAFRFICNAGPLRRDDPIVFPGQSGRSHLHQFFGNTAADANSTYRSLRTTGNSTCNSPLNRSAYWMPAMLDGAGGVVRPDFVSIYYKRLPASDPHCRTMAAGGCVPLPRGLRFIFGYDMINGAPKTGAGYFNCQGPTATPGAYPDIVTAAKYCPAGNQLGAIITAPTCWDGVNVDSADHRSHVAYAYYDNGVAKCPADHGFVIPGFTLGVWYTVDSRLDTSGTWNGSTRTWHLSSDEMPGMPMMRPGSTFHADWFGAWDDTVMKMWTDNCINKMLNCSGGDLGNGRQMKMYSGFTWTASPHTVPVPD